MSSITLKNVPETLLDILRDAAEREHRSLTQQIIHLLEVAVSGRVPSPGHAAVDAQVAVWRRLAGVWPAEVDGTELMDARTAGREVDL